MKTVPQSDLEEQEDENSRLMVSLDRLGEKQQQLIDERDQLHRDVVQLRGELIEARALIQLLVSGQRLLDEAEAWLKQNREFFPREH